MKLSQSDQAIINAVNAGYTANEKGQVFKPNGKEIFGSYLKHSKHLRITFYYGKEYKSALKHRFIYYYFYGNKLFEYPLIRHLDDNPINNNIENLMGGTAKENRRDIPKEKLSRIAKQHAHILIKNSRKLSDDDVLSLRNVRKSTNISYKKLAEMFGISTMTAYRAVNFQSWKELPNG